MTGAKGAGHGVGRDEWRGTRAEESFFEARNL